MQKRLLRARFDGWVWRVHCRALYCLALAWRRFLVRTEFVAVTGSRGKTTCKNLIAAALSASGPTVSTPGNDNGLLGVPRTVLAVRPYHRFAVVEAGTDGPGIMRRWARLLRPRVAVVVTVSVAHRNRFKTLAATAKEKACIFDGLAAGGVAVLNCDDDNVAGMSVPAGTRVLRVGKGVEREVRIHEAVSSWPERLRVELEINSRRVTVQTSLVGTHWATSVAVAVAVADAFGVDPEEAARRVAGVSPAEGRMQPVRLPDGRIVIRDEYQGGADTYRPAFEILARARVPGRRILLMGDPTDSNRDTSTRIRRLAREAVRSCELLIFFGEHSRHAVAAVIAAGFERERVAQCGTIAEAAAFLRRETKPGDLLLLKGRTTDHTTRVLFAASGTVSCTLRTCRKMILCEHCNQLGYEPSPDLGSLHDRPPHAWIPLADKVRESS